MATEYRMVVLPSEGARALGLRPRHYTYPKKNYAHATKGVTNHETQKAEGRFENTWVQDATVYIETREVSKWEPMEMGDATEDAHTTSRPDSSPSNSPPR